MHEDFKEQLRKTLGSVSEALETILDGATSLLENQRWRDVEKEPPTPNENLLLWVESAYDVGYLGYQGTWYYFSLSRRNFHDAPQAWMPLPPSPPKGKPT